MHRRWVWWGGLVAVAVAIVLSGAGAAWGASSAEDTSRVHVGPADGGTDAFVAWPAGSASAPAVVVVHEWWGLNTQIREVAKRLARQGYVAIVPDLYHGKVADDPETAHILMRGIEDDIVIADLSSAVQWLRAQPRVAKSKIGSIGFCMGGAYSQRLALHDKSIAAAVMFYGQPETDPQKLMATRAPLQSHFGAEDQGIPATKVDQLRAALKKAGRSGEVYVYPGAGHAFMNDARPSYQEAAARQAWARMLAFLQKNLKG